MTQPRSLSDVRKTHRRLLYLRGTQRTTISQIEEHANRHYGANLGQLFGIHDHVPNHELRRAVALMLKRHPDLAFAPKQIALYLHATKDEVERYLFEAEEILANAQTNPERDKLMVFMQFVGPALSQVIRMA